MNESDTEQTPRSQSEQRDHLANVRTLLAWVRTAVTVMAFGFVVAKFGLILDELPGHHHSLGLHVAAIIGTVLVIAGAVFLVLSTVEFIAVSRSIEQGRVRFRPELFITLSAMLVVVAVILAVYLLATA